jgi:hypothetical protein
MRWCRGVEPGPFGIKSRVGEMTGKAACAPVPVKGPLGCGSVDKILAEADPAAAGR